jgi:hypothetical protein
MFRIKLLKRFVVLIVGAIKTLIFVAGSGQSGIANLDTDRKRLVLKNWARLVFGLFRARLVFGFFISFHHAAVICGYRLRPAVTPALLSVSVATFWPFARFRNICAVCPWPC